MKKMADAMVHIIQSIENSLKMGNHGKKKLESHYNFNNSISQV